MCVCVCVFMYLSAFVCARFFVLVCDGVCWCLCIFGCVYLCLCLCVCVSLSKFLCFFVISVCVRENLCVLVYF